MRYLTHESEDGWWKKQGAKPHPLVVKNEQRFSHHTYHNLIILEEPHPGAPSIATTAAIAKLPQLHTITKPPDTSPKTNGSIKGSETSDTPRKNCNKISNDVIANIERHAKKVGYTVSTV